MKILKVLVIFAFSCAAYSAPTMYGKLKMSYGSVSQDTNTIYGFNSNNSRVGFKGSQKFENWDGVTGFYNIQLGWAPSDQVSNDKPFTNRIAFAGLKGKYGSVKFGRLNYGYKMVGLKMDAFYDSSAGLKHGGANFGLSSMNNGWHDNSVEFISMDMMGLVFNMQLVMDESSHNSQNDLNLGLTYTMKDMLQVSLQYLADKDIDAADEEEYLRANIRGWFGDFEAGLSYETVKTHSITEEPSKTYLYGVASWSGIENNKISLSYGKDDSFMAAGKKDYDSTGTGMSIGSFYSLSKSTIASVIYSKVDYDDAYTTANSTKDREIFALGLETNF